MFVDGLHERDDLGRLRDCRDVAKLTFLKILGAQERTRSHERDPGRACKRSLLTPPRRVEKGAREAYGSV